MTGAGEDGVARLRALVRGAPPIAVALDTPDLPRAVGLAEELVGHVAVAKVGLELFAQHGPDAVRAVGRHLPVFLDVKLHDIPTTVQRAAAVLGGVGAALVTVHASGGRAMLDAARAGLLAGAREARRDEVPLLLAVTVLTSSSDDDLASVQQPAARSQVPALARLAADAGVDGLVCAPADLAMVRDLAGDDLALVVPGIRPVGAGVDDHARGATPRQALDDGADLLVVGRPITQADDPVAAADALLA